MFRAAAEWCRRLLFGRKIQSKNAFSPRLGIFINFALFPARIKIGKKKQNLRSGVLEASGKDRGVQHSSYHSNWTQLARLKSL